VRSLAIVIILLISSSLSFGQDKKVAPQGMQFSKDPQVQQIRPKKPLRIKLHRNAKGEYTWDITGDNVDEIIRADARLRRLLKLD
jgi:predicted secreted protein